MPDMINASEAIAQKIFDFRFIVISCLPLGSRARMISGWALIKASALAWFKSNTNDVVTGSKRKIS